MLYERLDHTSLLNYIQATEALKYRYKDYNRLIVKEIGDGNLNYVYLIQDPEAPSQDLIIKQAVPFCRCLGEEYSLAIERMHYEIRSLQYFSSLCPQYIPKIFKADEDMALIAMQYLSEHKSARTCLIQGESLPSLVSHVTDFMAKTHFATSAFFLSTEKRRHLMQQFNNNSDLCKITEDYVFTLPFIESTSHVITDEIKTKILALKYKFMTETQALLHGDMHTGSMMVNANETYIIDSEFAVFGPIGYDIGLFLANMIFAWARHRFCGNHTYANLLENEIQNIWIDYQEKFMALWLPTDNNAMETDRFFTTDIALDAFKQTFMLSILRDTVGFACCEILRRILGVAKVADIESIENNDIAIIVKQQLIVLACNMLEIHSSIHSVADIMRHLKAATVVPFATSPA